MLSYEFVKEILRTCVGDLTEITKPLQAYIVAVFLYDSGEWI